MGGDLNSDLINLFRLLQAHGIEFIAELRAAFPSEAMSKDLYYAARDEFNARRLDTTAEGASVRAGLFLLLNKTGFNGLCRFNAKTGNFTTLWNHADRQAPFPQAELELFISRLAVAEVFHASFEETIGRATLGDVIYCDPPYLPHDNQERTFTAYAKGEFNMTHQEPLVELALENQAIGIKTVISNHDCALARELYSGATRLVELTVQRSMNRYSNHKDTNKVGELLAIYEPT